MKKDTSVLRVQPLYTTIMWGLLTCTLIFFIFLPILLGWDYKSAYGVVWAILMSFLAVVCLLHFVYYIQYAHVNDEELTIKGLFRTIVKIKWGEIQSISIDNVITYDSRANIYLNWLVIKKHKEDQVKGRGGINRKNKSPWYIIVTKKNVEILRRYYEF